ncbi:MAG: thioredoxin family protein [Ignavibacteria bacterium]|nr:thioredoxin family protein [Ignavibacteria bacterium]
MFINIFKLFTKLTLIIAAVLFLSFSNYENETPAGNSVKDFNLMNVDGKLVSLSDYPDAKGFIIIFTCNHCPFAKLYPQRMNGLNIKYRDSGVPLIAISSTDTAEFEEDSYTKMIQKSESENFNFPYLFDGEQTVAKDFGAQKTPHAFVIWKENNEWVIKYNGAIDDNGAEPDKVINKYAADAVDALLKGSEVKVKETKSIGCQILFRR